jgi:N-acetylmuramoyl-L-alanine amidase
MNRVRNSEFPDTVKEVVFQRVDGHVQFSPTADGRYESVNITDETVEAVNCILAGEDYSQGALFFSARDKADPTNMSWFDNNLKWLFVYGGHEFYTLK